MHVVVRCNNLEFYFAAPEDFEILLDLAREGHWKKFLHVSELINSIRFGGGLFFRRYKDSACRRKKHIFYSIN